MNRRATLVALALLAACGGSPSPHSANGSGAPADPASDIDSDGIPDRIDRCADQPEDVDQWEDSDGCPDTDNDQDGLADSIDLCPDDWEDCDGFQDTDGCPDLDNDQDRIPDACDSCPNDPELYNGVEDGDGCPDRGYVIVSESQIVILEHIYFQKNSADIMPVSLPIVDAIAATLAGNPQIEMMGIVGHAESQERNPHRIAQQRAEALRDALVARGIAPNRLEVREAGNARPVDQRNTPDAREKNRRVEFMVVRIDGTEQFHWVAPDYVSTPPPPPTPGTPPPRPLVDPRNEIQPACAGGISPRPLRPPPGGCGAVQHAGSTPAPPPLPPLIDGGIVPAVAPLDLRDASIVPPELRRDAAPPL